MRRPFCTVGRLTTLLFALSAFAGYSTALRAQEARSITKAAEAALIAQSATPAAGAEDADVTIIEFFDYNCPFCKKTAPELRQLLRTDPKVRVLHKEWPIFGDVSSYAARSALAANWQGKYLPAHDALIGAHGDLEEASQVDSLLKAAGIDLPRLVRDRERHSAEIDVILARSAGEAQQLGFRGTPGYVIGRQLVPRSLTLAMLQQLVRSARSAP